MSYAKHKSNDAIRRLQSSVDVQATRDVQTAVRVSEANTSTVVDAAIATHEAALNPHPQYGAGSASTTLLGTAGTTEYVPPSYARVLQFDVAGGGGGGGGGVSDDPGLWRYGGSSGGGGGRSTLTVTRDQFSGTWPTILVTVGAGGNGGAAETNGSEGGDSSVSIGGVVHAIAEGGEAGTAGNITGIGQGNAAHAWGTYYGARHDGQWADPPGGLTSDMAGASGGAGGNLDDTNAIRTPGAGGVAARAEGAGTLLGNGGDGGAAALGANASNGVDGGACSGGGGGGAAETGYTAGAGGDGGAGVVVIRAW